MLSITPKQYVKDLIEQINSINIELDSREGVYSSDLGYLGVSKHIALIQVNELYELSAQLNSVEMINYFTDVLSEINSFK